MSIDTSVLVLKMQRPFPHPRNVYWVGMVQAVEYFLPSDQGGEGGSSHQAATRFISLLTGGFQNDFPRQGKFFSSLPEAKREAERIVAESAGAELEYEEIRYSEISDGSAFVAISPEELVAARH